jgi:cytoskeletal protein RodZ
MSSLSDLLNQYSQDISARVRHQDDADREIADRKAQTIQEKYQQVRDHFESAGNDLMGAGAAIHMGRKVYNKWAERNAAARQSQKAASDNANDANATADERPTLRTNTGNQDTRAPTGETDEAAPVEPEPLARGGRASAAPRSDLGTIDERLPRPTERTPFPTEQAKAQQFDRISDMGQQRQQAQAEATAPDDHIAPDSNAHAGAPAQQAGTEGSRPLPEGMENMGREGTPLQESPNHVGSGANVDNPTAPEGGARFTPEDIEEGSRAFARPGAGAVDSVGATSGGAVDGSSGALDTGINGAKSVLSKAGGGAMEGIGDALPEVSGVLDALGPIGEIFGVLTSIAGAIEGATSKPAEEKELQGGGASTAGPEQAGAGMDEKALSAPVSQAGTFTA